MKKIIIGVAAAALTIGIAAPAKADTFVPTAGQPIVGDLWKCQPAAREFDCAISVPLGATLKIARVSLPAVEAAVRGSAHPWRVRSTYVGMSRVSGAWVGTWVFTLLSPGYYTAAPTPVAPAPAAPTPASPPVAAAPAPSNGGTVSQSNAARMAREYLAAMAFSRSGLIKQLEYEGFSNAEATAAVDAVSADWNQQAAKMAGEYLRSSAFSRSGLIGQLEYEGFTTDQAVYGVNSVGL